MKLFTETCNLWLSCILLLSGMNISAFSYDYSSTTKCLVEPQRAQYGGGMIVNPEFNHSLEGWTMFGQGEIEERISKAGNSFIVVHNRTHPLDSLSQKVLLEKGKLYSFSAWIQISEGRETVSVLFKTADELVRGGKVIAEHGCWSLLKGGIVANFSTHVEILFESKNTKVDIWVNNVSLQPFTKEQWKSHQDISISKIRKSKVRFKVIHANKTAMQGAIVSIKQLKSNFPFGCGMNYRILESTDYQNWFASRFKFTTFTNEMKWYGTEKIQGQENYTVPDAMVKFSKQNGISIRGHNIFWDNPKQQPNWVKSLSSDDLRKAVEKRINSVVSRYRGQLIAWDVVNENLHFRYFEDKLGENASAVFYSKAYQLDPNTNMFMNEYGTINGGDEKASPANYKKKIEEILQYPGNEKILLAIGLQGNFGSGQPNLAYMRSSLDILGATGLPIWLTEVSVGVAKDIDQAQHLEDILREGYSHPAVKGIVMFAGPIAANFKEMPLADTNFKNTPAGDVVDKLLHEWKHCQAQEFTADDKGFVDVLLFHGDYNVTVQHTQANSSTTLGFRVTKDTPQATIDILIHT
ncbi:hypothetical protein CMV_012369 [Castanea mollissima]|uniref:GH10 domain-containing protein n=1 Tax=Castanea mollissima TaxID=60419 RepID=A0A8J4VZB8_9ROSI|nr:hypothetical protein CMV_012369 [Castanea mollissima]